MPCFVLLWPALVYFGLLWTYFALFWLTLDLLSLTLPSLALFWLTLHLLSLTLPCFTLLCFTLPCLDLLCPALPQFTECSYLPLLCFCELVVCLTLDLLCLTLACFPLFCVTLDFDPLWTYFALLYPTLPQFTWSTYLALVSLVLYLSLPLPYFGLLCLALLYFLATSLPYLLPPGPAYLLLLPPTNYYHYLQVTALPKYYYPSFAPVYLVYLLNFTQLYSAYFPWAFALCLPYFTLALYLGPPYYYHQVNYQGYHLLLSVPLGLAHLFTTRSSSLVYRWVQLTCLPLGPAYLFAAASKIFTSQLCLPQVLPVRTRMSFQHGSKYYPCCPLFCPCHTFWGPLLKSLPPSLNAADTVSARSCQCAVGFFSNIPQNTPLVALYFVHVTHSGVPG